MEYYPHLCIAKKTMNRHESLTIVQSVKLDSGVITRWRTE
nr:MAG TPA: hypothetical protein [Caudoviricetes sp.]